MKKKSILRTVFGFVFDFLFDLYGSLALGVRRIVTTGVFTIASLLLLLSGFLLIHGALFILLPWSESTKGMILLALGLFYFLLPIGVLSRLLSKRRWLELFGADD